MTFTVALLILALGVLIGYHLPGPVAALKTFLRRRRYRPQLLRPWQPDGQDPDAIAPAATQAPRHHG